MSLNSDRGMAALREVNEASGIVPVNAETTAALVRQIGRLQRMVAELANDLETEIEGRYQGTKGHPAIARRYWRDMETVIRARVMLRDAGEPNE